MKNSWEKILKRRRKLKFSLRKQPTFREVATWALAKRRLSNERRNSILMTCTTQILVVLLIGWKENSLASQPIRSTTKIWVVTRHQYGISALVMRDLAMKKNRSRYSLKALFYPNHFCQQWRELYQHVRSVCVPAVIFKTAWHTLRL